MADYILTEVNAHPIQTVLSIIGILLIILITSKGTPKYSSGTKNPRHVHPVKHAASQRKESSFVQLLQEQINKQKIQ